MKSEQPRIAVIGCGAVTKWRHLPALAKLGVTPVLLVDPDMDRARGLAEAFRVPGVAADYRPHLGEFDAAIIASPHHLHAPVSIDLLGRGVHVLLEKPMAMTAAECDQVMAAAEAGGSVLAVGLMRRYFWAARWLKAALGAGALGPIESFDVREGFIYEWPVASSFFFRKETAGGGVLFDLGAHTLDLLLWWLGDVAEFEYYDDSYGGVEADCKLRLTMASGARGTVELSRTRNLRNTAVLRGPRGEIEIGLDRNYLRADPAGLLSYKKDEVRANVLPEDVLKELNEMFVLQAEDWLRAIREGVPPQVPGAEAKRSIGLIGACYANRRRWELPWVHTGGRGQAREAGLRLEAVKS